MHVISKAFQQLKWKDKRQAGQSWFVYPWDSDYTILQEKWELRRTCSFVVFEKAIMFSLCFSLKI